MIWFASKLLSKGKRHDFTKIDKIDDFYRDFINNFETQEWYDFHKQIERHHISEPDGVRDDVDMLDVLEHIADIVVASKARHGKFFFKELPEGVLELAFRNTINKLLEQVKVVD